MYITQKEYARACGVCVETVGRRFKYAPWHTSRGRTRFYNLAQVIPTVRPREIAKGAVTALVASAAPPDDALYVGGAEALPIARALIEWLPEDMRKRCADAQNAFIVGIGNSSMCSPAVVENLGILQMLIILQPDVLRHVLTGSPADVERLAPAFALVNNSSSFVTMKEAA